MTEHPTDAKLLLPSPIERLAEHLCARRPCGDTPENVADWLDYSLNRCGLVVVEEQSLAMNAARTTPIDDEGPSDATKRMAKIMGAEFVPHRARNSDDETEALMAMGRETQKRMTTPINSEGLEGWIASERMDYSTSPARHVDFDDWAKGYEACLEMLERYIKASLPTPVIEEGLVERLRQFVELRRRIASPSAHDEQQLIADIESAIEAIRASNVS